MNKKCLNGFHLVEIMIVLVLVSILTSVCLPNYSRFINKSRRTEAKIALAELALAMEQYYFEHEHFIGATLSALYQPDDCAEHHYKLSILSAGDSYYLLAAIPQGQQAIDDAVCGTLTLDSAGIKRINGYGNWADCW